MTLVVLQNIFTYRLKKKRDYYLFIEQKALASIARPEGKKEEQERTH